MYFVFVRFCTSCQSAVHLVEHEKELAEMARQGKCVAIQSETLTLIGFLRRPYKNAEISPPKMEKPR